MLVRMLVRSRVERPAEETRAGAVTVAHTTVGSAADGETLPPTSVPF